MAQKTHRAVIHTAPSTPLSIQDVPIPSAGPGSAVVQILATPILAYMSEVISGKRQYPMSLPLTPGTSAIGRVYATGPDTASLTPGMLVLCNMFVTARDDPSVQMLMGLFSAGASRTLMDGEWRHSTWAEYAKFPLENLYPLNEELLLKKQGYSIHDLCKLPMSLVPYGGLDEIDLKVGETIVIAPATGQFGGSAVGVALAMGAHVIAMGRNRNTLKRLEDAFGSTNRLTTVPMTGTLEGDVSALRGASATGFSAVLDLSPPAAADNTYFPAAVSLLKHSGRVAVMGHVKPGMEIPWLQVMHANLRLYGKWMYTPQQVRRGVQMAEMGLLALGERAGVVTKGGYSLEDIDAALEKAAEEASWGVQVVLEPGVVKGK